MAKTDGTQNIPSELLDLYRASLGEERPDDTIEKRYPYRIPKMQEGKSGETATQRKQRFRFKFVFGRFNLLSWEERQRWYAAMPEWGSLLWYYNFFILSGIMGGSVGIPGGAGVIKSIQFIKEEVPTTGTKVFAINAVDPARTVVMMFGNSYISDKIQRGTNTISDGGSNNHALSPNVDVAISEVKIEGFGGREEISEGTGDGGWAKPYAFALIPSQLTVKMVDMAGVAFSVGYSWEVIEHKAQTIYPVIVSIAAEAVTIDWSKVPSVAADISLIVIEYI